MEELEAERDLVESIRAGVAAAAKVVEGGLGSSCLTIAMHIGSSDKLPFHHASSDFNCADLFFHGLGRHCLHGAS